MDLQGMSESPHEFCPECGKTCERIISIPMISVKGAEYRAAEKAEKRARNIGLANEEHAQLRAETEQRILGHTHNCVAAGCFGTAARESTNAASMPGEPVGVGDRIRGMPYLVGQKTKSKDK